jgi:hypothetical protein
MSQSHCLLQKCIFFIDEKHLCIFFHQFLISAEALSASAVATLSSLENQHIFDELNASVGLPLLEIPVRVMVIYLEFLGRLLADPHFPQKQKKKFLKLRSDLEMALSDFAYTVPPE